MKAARTPHGVFDLEVLTDKIVRLNKDGNPFLVIQLYDHNPPLIAIQDELVRVRLTDGTVIQ